MILQGALWLTFSVAELVTVVRSSFFVIILMLANGAFFLFFGIIRKKEKSLFFIPALCFLAVNLILTLADQTGFFDWCVFALNILSVAGYFILYFLSRGQPRGTTEGNPIT